MPHSAPLCSRTKGATSRQSSHDVGVENDPVDVVGEHPGFHAGRSHRRIGASLGLGAGAACVNKPQVRNVTQEGTATTEQGELTLCMAASCSLEAARGGWR